jgi:hypothetical protein
MRHFARTGLFMFPRIACWLNCAVMLIIGGGWLLAPQQAWGSCGDYLTTAVHREPALAGGDDGSRSATTAVAGSPARRPDSPCDGPVCRKARPPVLPTVSVRFVYPEMAILAPRTLPPPRDGIWDPGVTGAWSAQAVGDGIFHPPRADLAPLAS